MLELLKLLASSPHGATEALLVRVHGRRTRGWCPGGPQASTRVGPEEIARKSYYKLDQAAPIAKVEDLADYDAIIVGAGTRFGRLSSWLSIPQRKRSTGDAMRLKGVMSRLGWRGPELMYFNVVDKQVRLRGYRRCA
jgi:hypothetical protein